MKNFITHINTVYTDKEWMIFPSINAISAGFIVVILIICGLDSSMVFSEEPLHYWLSIGWVVSSILPVFLLIILRVLDGLIEHASNEITDGEKVIHKFFYSRIYYYDSYHSFNYFQVGLVLGTLASIIFGGIALCMYNPWLFIVPVLVGGYFALVKLAKLVYRINTSLERHKVDPDAHKTR